MRSKYQVSVVTPQSKLSHLCCAAVLLCCTSNSVAQVQGQAGGSVPHALIQEAAERQVAILRRSGWYLRYRTHKVDLKKDTVRDVIETVDGTVARLIARNGKPLPSDEDKDEQDRLRELNRWDLQKRKKQEAGGMTMAVELTHAMPDAMIYTYAAGQPKSTADAHDEIVIDFRPDPGFHPASTAQTALAGLEGRLWLDSNDHHVVRLDGRIVKNVNLAWGLVARIFPGGTITFRQAKLGEGRYMYAGLAMDLTMRELLVKTVHVKSEMQADHFQVLPRGMTSDEAIRLLLDGVASPR